MRELLVRNRRRINQELPDPRRRQFLSPGTLAGTRNVMPALLGNLHGDVLDVGCGDMPYRAMLLEQVHRYDGLDVEARADGVTYLGDAQDMPMIPSDRYDGALCLEVLEHLPEPRRALAEIYRVLKPGGCLVLSVPHISRLHEEPHDYYRYTRHGLRYLLEQTGFEVQEIRPHGGLFGFGGHQLSSVLLLPLWHIPVLKWIIWCLNKWLVTWPLYWLDRLLDRRHLMATGYVAIARKRNA